MTEPTPSTKQRRPWLLGCSVIVFAVVLETIPQLVFGRSHMGTRVAYWLFQTTLVVAALSLHHSWGTRRRIGTLRMLLVSIAISTVVGALCGLFLSSVVNGLLAAPPRSLSSTRATLVSGVVLGLVQCGIWGLGFIYPSAVEDARLRTLEAEKLRLETETLKLEAEKLRAAAELSRLRSQLEPHFLLNTLNAIAGLVTQQPREARRLLGCLGDLLRDSLRDPDEMQTLEDEIAWLRRYAEILESRHAGVLTFRWEIDDDAKAALLPRLLLQPLVENAVKHGALHRSSGGGEVVVRASISASASAREDGGDNGLLVCVVEDNGPGIAIAEPRSGAFGLRSVRRRLELKFETANLAIESSASGTRSIVTIPRLSEKSS